jgi:hypothetical protein
VSSSFVSKFRPGWASSVAEDTAAGEAYDVIVGRRRDNIVEEQRLATVWPVVIYIDHQRSLLSLQPSQQARDGEQRYEYDEFDHLLLLTVRCTAQIRGPAAAPRDRTARDSRELSCGLCLDLSLIGYI